MSGDNQSANLILNEPGYEPICTITDPPMPVNNCDARDGFQSLAVQVENGEKSYGKMIVFQRVNMKVPEGTV